MKSYNRLATLIVLIVSTAQLALGTPLDDYVAAPDASYRYSLVQTITGMGYTAYVLDMTSQSWRSKTEVDRTAWQHWLTIIKPDKAAGNKALLWINGGSNDRPAPSSADEMFVGVALGSNSVVADLRMVPNQPLNFPDGGGPRKEDAIISYTFDKYLTTGDQTWPLLLPMVKSAVRAMDTIHSHILDVTGGKMDINEFVVSGASKRGWTTWLTAAVDKRVIAIIPAVIDVLNMKEQMRHHFSAYGFYSKAIGDYEQMKILERLDTAEGQKLHEFVDPYEYRSRYTMPKFIVNSTGDEFFPSDSAQFYFHDLPGEKYLRYIPNTDHSLNTDAVVSLSLFYKSVLTGSPRPQFSWSVKDDGSIVVKTGTTPAAVNLLQATNAKTRDFRLETIGPAWKSSPLAPQPDGTYTAKVAEPQEGWTAFFVELTFDSSTPIPYKLTTEVHVVPERLPFADKLSLDTDVKSSKPAYSSSAKPSAEKVLYAELTPQEFRERIAAAPIAYLPLGTLEWHGEHLPIGADGLQSYGFFIHLAQRAGGIVLPMLFLGPDVMQQVDGRELYGMDTLGQAMPEGRRYENQQLAGSAYWVPEETFRIIIEATLKQLRRAGFRIVVAHGHGPSTNFFSKHAADWKQKFGLETFVCFGSDFDRQGMGIQVDHAAANETSLVMALRPELVQMERLPAVSDRWPVGVSGKDPRIAASPELGRKIIDLQTERMSKILRDALANRFDKLTKSLDK